jgi:hypothetical protein
MLNQHTLNILTKLALAIKIFLFVIGIICGIWVKLDPSPMIGFEIIVLMWSLIVSILTGAVVIILGVTSSIASRSFKELNQCIIAIFVALISVFLIFTNLGWEV